MLQVLERHHVLCHVRPSLPLPFFVTLHSFTSSTIFCNTLLMYLLYTAVLLYTHHKFNRRVSAALLLAALAGALHGFVVSAFIGIATARFAPLNYNRVSLSITRGFGSVSVYASIEFGDVECAVGVTS